MRTSMRTSQIRRRTAETEVRVKLAIDGSGRCDVQTPLLFFNHLLTAFGRHGLFDLSLRGRGDVTTDAHHLVEDCGIVLGDALRTALGDLRGVVRAGCFVMLMDEARAFAAVDICGRPAVQYRARFRRRRCGDFDSDLVEDFLGGLASRLGAALALETQRGRSDHHKLEAMFKALGRALRQACTQDERLAGRVASTKEVI